MKELDLSAMEIPDSAAGQLAVLTARAASAPAGLLYFADGDRLRLLGASGLRDGWQALAGSSASLTMGWIVLASGQPTVVEDVRNDDRVPPDAFIHTQGGRAYAGYPIRSKDGKVVGVCAAMDFVPRVWAASELEGIEAATRVCAAFLLALGARAEADRERRFLDGMRDRPRVGVTGADPRDAEQAAVAALVGASTIEEAGPDFLRAVCEAVGWSAAELWLADEEPDVLRPMARVHVVPGSGLPVPSMLSRGSGLAGTAWERNDVVWARDLAGPSGLFHGQGMTGSRVRAGVAVPVPNGGATLGVLCFFADAFEGSEHTVAVLLSSLAGHIAHFLLRRRAEDAELALARSKDEYLFLVGHELRTPLTSIASYTELLAENPSLDPDSRRLLEVIDRNTGRLRHIIEELLDLAALDSGHADLVRERIELGPILQAAIDDTRADAQQANVVVRGQFESGLAVEGDGDRLRQVLDHLLRNAVTHGPGGTVTVTANRHPTGALEIAVADTGVGIPDDEGDSVFRPFYRTVLSREQQLPGAGLGLALSRAIVQAHRGTIRLTANRPTGTRAVIRLPAAP